MPVPFPRDTSVRPTRPDRLKICSVATLFFLPLLWAWELAFAENGSLSALALYLPQHFYLILPTVLLVLALFKRHLKIALLNILSLTFCLLFPLGWKLHLPSSSAASAIRLVSFNIHRGEGDEPLVEKTLHSLHPDVICLQETGLSTNLQLNTIGRHVALGYPGWNARYAGDVTTLTRFPILSERIHSLPGTRRTLETVLQTQNGPLRVLNTHVSTHFKGDRAPTSKIDKLVLLYETAYPSAQVRLQQLPQLLKAVQSGNARIPLILAGDFNSPPRGHFYNGLRRELNDAFSQVGNGLGLTFPASLPLLRIDYVFTRGVRATRAIVGAPSGSDHHPLITDLEVLS